MATFLENSYSLVHQDNAADIPSQNELKQALEKGTDETKIETMKKILSIMLNGDPQAGMLMHIIRFVMPSKSKPLKKLMYLFLEVCPKHDAQGKLRQEWILVCNAIRFDLQAPNEYVRGNTLRFLCKLRDAELVEPLLQPARQCLTHRHAYVRKNATFAIASIYTHLPELLPDAPDLLMGFLDEENDATCKRNAFAALASISHEKALEYLSTVFDSIPNHDELVLLAELEFIRRDAAINPQNKARYLRLIFDLLESTVSTVIYEAAHALTTLTHNPVAVKAAAGKFIELAIKEPDNNVKLIVLERVDQLREKNEGILDDLTMEVLRVLSSTDLDVRKKALKIALEMVTSRNVEEVVLLLKKELTKTVDEQYEKNTEYRSLLISSIHQSAVKFPEVAASVVGSLMDLIADASSNASAVDVISFVKEVVERFPNLRTSIVERLVQTLAEVRSGKVYRGILWIIGEYSLEAKDIRDAWKGIRSSLGEIPILASEQRLLDEASEGKEENDQVNGHAKTSAPSGSRKVLADGTYATETAFTSSAADKAKLDAVKNSQKPPLRQLILDGDYYLSTVLSSTLTKLVMRHSEISKDTARTNALRAEAMLIMISIIRVGQSQFVKNQIDEDSIDRIMSCVRSLSEFAQRKDLETVFLEDTRKSFRTMVQTEEKKRAAKEAVERSKSAVNVDDAFSIRQLKKKDMDGTDEIEQDLERATGGDTATEDLTSKLSRVVQLTGFSDPVYAEAYVKVHQFDIVLDVLLVNQTTETLQNLTVEFATLGDLKVVERPPTQNVGPHDFINLQATIKVSSTDTGVIFGNVIYEGEKGVDSNVVILNDVHVDIMDYIKPATCTETQFRTMWTEFEWENKVNINNTKAKSLREFLQQLMACTNMNCLTPEASMKGDCQFLSANLYARSVFGEDALANLSIEKEGENGPITGFVRIRSRSQGLALSLGSLKGLNKVGSS
ncbi:coatomer subunit beta [Sporormia fimetaria CBS 119925]|uniref:Coatomer subunit beta n=1 Tax=Sporormia fimetaria CBS 119925 TaxID=1340428 RepID=A0A6A6V696_9PLEO|nr:coatomer subunit beta [Sporormia fimetaria CBS 119925]